MTEFSVPADFPTPLYIGAIAGVQPKFLAVEYEGRYYSPGCTPPEVYERWQNCVHYVPQFVFSCLKTKAGKRAHMTEEAILDQYLVRLVATNWVSDVEARWIIREVARQLDWPIPEAANQPC